MAALLVLIALAIRGRRAPRARCGWTGPARRPTRSRGWAMATVLAWALLPAVLAFIDALVSQPLFLPRNLLVSVPAIALALAVGICDHRLPPLGGGCRADVRLPDPRRADGGRLRRLTRAVAAGSPHGCSRRRGPVTA